MRSASLLECRSADGSATRGPVAEWGVAGAVGDNPVTRPDEADVNVPVSDRLTLAMAGRPVPDFWAIHTEKEAEAAAALG